MSVRAEIIIGANYGDEGKGLATHFFTQRAIADGGRVLNVLYNGGPQRGHTVEYKNGVRHIFHHFGSGFLDGAQTYFDADFMVNPIFFRKEWEELKQLVAEQAVKDKPERFNISPMWESWQIYISPDCRVITPWDSFVNQIAENSRGKNRHGSCGFGIWETQKRYENGFGWSFEDMTKAIGDGRIFTHLKEIRDVYAIRRLKEYGIDDIPIQYREVFYSDKLLENYVMDLFIMSARCKLVRSYEDLAAHYRTMIFEAGQGLALDEGNKEALPHVTASKTGSAVPVKRIRDLADRIDICYVTRSYFTRHGAGPFPTECPASEINQDSLSLIDCTNVPNQFQQHFRYGKFDSREFLNRICDDRLETWKIRSNVTASCLITHLNETNGDICGDTDIKELGKFFYDVYLSDSRYAENIRKDERRKHGIF